jgi:putative ABC transport system permease protein
MWGDLRIASRSLRNSSGFTLSSLLLISLGIAMSTLVFCAVDAVYFRPLPFASADDLFIIGVLDPDPTCRRACSRPTTLGEMARWLSDLRGVEMLSGLRVYQASVVTGVGNELEEGALVTPNFFQLLGVHALLGREFLGEDARAPDTPVVILDEAFWRQRFGANQGILDSTVKLSSRSYRVVGIMPAARAVGAPIFRATAVSPAFYVITREPNGISSGETRYSTLLARLSSPKAVVGLASQLGVLVANAPANDLASRAMKPPDWRIEITSLREAHAKYYAGPFRLLLGAVLCVMLVACANVAGLFFARLIAKQRETAIRAALGGSRMQLIRPALFEAGLLAVVGSSAGMVVAAWGIGLARALIPVESIPYWTAFVFDWRVYSFSGVIAILSAALFGLGPALALTGTSVVLVLPRGGSFEGNSRWQVRVRETLVCLEVASTVVLLACASLLAKTLYDAESRDLGMSRNHVVRGFLYGREGPFDSPQKQRELASKVLLRLQELPSVVAASLSGGQSGPAAKGLLRDSDRELIPAGVAPTSADGITPDEFRVQGISLIRGRAFTAADDAGSAPVAIVDEPTAQRLFPGGSAIGHRIRFAPQGSSNEWMTIVGVVGAVRADPFHSDQRYTPAMYRPLSQAPTSMLAFAVRSRGEPEKLFPAVRAALRDVAP